MEARRKSIKLLGHERSALVKLYLRWRIPTDQFERRAEEWDKFTKEWNRVSHRKDSRGEVLHYMRTQRKRGLWVTLDGDHTEVPDLQDFTPEETDLLVKLFEENVTPLDCGSDALAYELDLAEMLSREFADMTGRIVPANQLVAKITAIRKRGLLPKLGSRDKDRPKDDAGDVGFSDIADVG